MADHKGALISRRQARLQVEHPGATVGNQRLAEIPEEAVVARQRHPALSGNPAEPHLVG